MKKPILFLYLAAMLGLAIASCTPCDDGDADENSNSLETRQIHSDSTSVD